MSSSLCATVASEGTVVSTADAAALVTVVLASAVTETAQASLVGAPVGALAGAAPEVTIMVTVAPSVEAVTVSLTPQLEALESGTVSASSLTPAPAAVSLPPPLEIFNATFCNLSEVAADLGGLSTAPLRWARPGDPRNVVFTLDNVEEAPFHARVREGIETMWRAWNQIVAPFVQVSFLLLGHCHPSRVTGR